MRGALRLEEEPKVRPALTRVKLKPDPPQGGAHAGRLGLFGTLVRGSSPESASHPEGVGDSSPAAQNDTRGLGGLRAGMGERNGFLTMFIRLWTVFYNWALPRHHHKKLNRLISLHR
jgi:hypothetical protein